MNKINYPYLAGALESALQSLALALFIDEVVDDKTKELIQKEVDERIKTCYEMTKNYETC